MTECDGVSWGEANPSPILDAWHDCDGKIGKLLRFVTSCDEPARRYWSLLIIFEQASEYLPVCFCPICGEELEVPDA